MNMSHPPRFLQSLIGLECTRPHHGGAIYVIVDVISPRQRRSISDMRPPIDVVLCSPDKYEAYMFSVERLEDINLTPTSLKTLFSRLQGEQ